MRARVQQKNRGTRTITAVTVIVCLDLSAGARVSFIFNIRPVIKRIFYCFSYNYPPSVSSPAPPPRPVRVYGSLDTLVDFVFTTLVGRVSEIIIITKKKKKIGNT